MASFKLFRIYLVLQLIWLESSLISSHYFSVPLVHYNSPQSPFHNPDATQEDLIKEMVVASLSRSTYYSSSPSDDDMLMETAAGTSSPQYARAPFGNFLVNYSIGTPPVDAWGYMDTTSSFIWLDCLEESCVVCPQPPAFNPLNSSTYKAISCGPLCNSLNPNVDPSYCSSNVCTFAKTYGDYTVSEGTLSLETLYFTDNTTSDKLVAVENVVFGCGSSFTGPKAVPGVLGLGNNRYSIVGQLGQTRFSYLTLGSHSSPYGWIYFGDDRVQLGQDDTASSSPLLTSQDGRYFLSIEGITLYQESVKIPELIFNVNPDGTTGFMIDTSSPYTLIQGEVFDQMAEILREENGKDRATNTSDFEVCFPELGGDDFPEITFKLTGTDFPISEFNTWIQTNGLTCLAMLRAPANLSTLGMYQQHGIEFGYDLAMENLTFVFL